MIKKNFLFKLLFIMLLIIIFSSCQEKSTTGSDNVEYTTKWKEDGSGNIQFYCDNPKLKGFKFYKITENIYNTTTIEVELTRVSGNENKGQGIVFCFLDSNNFYSVLILNNQKYAILKKINGNYFLIREWTYCADLNPGYDVVNTILIDFDHTAHTIDISFNGQPALTQATDDSFTEGKVGFYAAVDSQDRLPGIPVDLRFKMNQPEALP